jgi:putative membrane protein
MPAVLQFVSSPGHAGAAAWTFEPITTVALLLLAAAVFVGRRRAPAASAAITASRWRLASFGAGIVVGLLAVNGWPAVYARTLMSVFVSQQLVLLLVSPVLVAFGRPLDALRYVRPGWTPPRPLTWVIRVATHALVGPLLVPIALSIVVFTGLPTHMANQVAVAGVVHLALLVVGLAIAAPLARDTSYLSSLAFGMALAFGLVELLVDAIPGIALRLDSHVLASVTDLAGRRDWGPTPISDQQTAGAIVWIVAEVLDLPFLLIVVVQWVRADTREAHRIDAQLDRAETEVALRRPVTVDEASGREPPPADPGREVPWWEKDAGVFGDARSRALESRRRPRRD